MADHLAIYRSFTVEELTAEIAALKAKYRSEFTSQSGGGVSASRDIAFVADKLEAATKALRQKTGSRRTYTLGTFN
jgi:methylmalonyl-CoA mutase N-terminal domain/subunit